MPFRPVRSVALAAFLLAGCCTFCKMDPVVHTMVLFEGETNCVAVPDTVFARKGDILSFYTKETSGRVKELNPLPDPEFSDRYGSGGRLTDRETVDVPPGTAVRVRISRDAKGLYRLPLACGRFDDDPPKIIVR